MNDILPYGRQDISEQDIHALESALRAPYLTQGPTVERFEGALSSITDRSHVATLNSGTSGLHAACTALGVGADDVVWTSPISFVASANCARLCGAQVDFVDIDPQTRNISIPKLADKLHAARATGRLPKVLIPVHFSGLSCDMEAISGLAQEFGTLIVEDAAHALGATYKDRPVGDCTWSDAAVFSFHPVKIITTLEGGAVATRDKALHQKVVSFRSHGITREPERFIHDADGPWHYEMQHLAYNLRLTDVQAALGISQLGRLGHFLERRRYLAGRYLDLLADLPVGLPLRSSASAWHLFCITVSSAARRNVFEALQRSGIGVNVHYIPIYKHPYYSYLGYSDSDFPAAGEYYAGAITLPLFPGMSDAQQDRVVSELRDALKRYL